jgi:hypothetical protein
LWAQLIEMRLKPGEDTTEMIDLIRAAEQPGSGLIRSLFMRDQADPDRVVTLVVFESEDTAREREANPRRASVSPQPDPSWPPFVDGPPAFTDLVVVDEWTDPTAQETPS